MGRAKQTPRLRDRNGIYYVVDGELRISTGFHVPHEEGKAKRALAAYLQGQERGAIPDSPMVADMLDAYTKFHTKKRIENAHKTARDRALNAGMSREDAEKRAKEAEQKITDAGTQQYNCEHLKRHIGLIETNMISNATARLYKEARLLDKNHNRKQTVQQSTIKRELNIFRAAINWAWSEDHEKWFPNRPGKPTFQMPVSDSLPRQNYLTKEQAKMIIDKCKSPHIKLFIKLALASGARRSAITELRWENVNFERKEIDFGISYSTKLRPVYKMSDSIYKDLKAAYKKRTTDWVIEWRGKRAADVKRGLTYAGKQCGISWLTPHVLKHTLISWLVSDGVPYDTIAILLKTSVKMIKNHYSHLAPPINYPRYEF